MTIRSLIPFGRTSIARSGEESNPFTLLRQQMDRMLEDFSTGWAVPALSNGDSGRYLLPRVDIVETDNGIEMAAELPGIDENDIDLEIEDGVLSLKAESKFEREEKDEKRHYHLVERSHGNFMRRFTLPFEVDEGKVEARFDKGVLNVFVPRAANAQKPKRKIEVRGGKGRLSQHQETSQAA